MMHFCGDTLYIHITYIFINDYAMFNMKCYPMFDKMKSESIVVIFILMIFRCTT